MRNHISRFKNYWTEKVKDNPHVRTHTSLKAEYSCAICGVSIEGMSPEEFDSQLFNNYKIHTDDG